MARTFLSASSQNLETLSTPIIGQVFSMSIWVFTTNAGLNQSVIWVGEDGDPDHFTTLQLLGLTGGDPCRLLKHFYGAGGLEAAVTANGFTQEKWHHVCGVVVSSSDMRCYLDADVANKGTNTNLKAVSNHDAMSIGHAADSTPGANVDGRLLDMAMWNRALSEDEITQMAAGYSAQFFTPDVFVPLIDDADTDVASGAKFTRTSTPGVASGPTLIYPTSVHYSFPQPSAAFVPFPRPRGLRGGMLELVGGMH